MAFKGTLKEFKVPDILQLLSLQKKTGILTFTSTEGFITLIFELGLICGVDSFPRKLEMRVGNVLVKQDIISDEMLQRALTIQKRTNQKIGEILVGMGLVGEETIRESLITQARQIILSLFKWKKGEYNFKIMEHLDRSMKIIEPIPTDNLIMEGVQMLDEWPLIKKQIPEETIIFEPVPVETSDIEIVDEYDDDTLSGKKNGKIYLSDSEANLLKYINGKNTVIDLVELGAFTEYKVYKSLFNLVNKKIIQTKLQTAEEAKEERGERTLDALGIDSEGAIDKLFNVLIIILILVFVLSFFRPLNPLKTKNILIREELYKTVLTETNAGNASKKSGEKSGEKSGKKSGVIDKK
ncbi:MAG: DUF4388 domain-containing protein [bacterium]|nr:DUF4388 domain-containing protein [bacterium]